MQKLTQLKKTACELSRLPRTWLWLIVSLAVLLRVTSAAYQGDSVVELPGTFDQVSYDLLARQVLDGYGFSFAQDWWPATKAGEPTAHWSFLYTTYLAGIYALFGCHPLIARLLQAVLAGVFYPFLTWRIGRRVFGENVGLLSALLAAVYTYFVYYAGALVTETFYVLGILWSLDLVTGAMAKENSPRFENRGWTRLRFWVLLGAVFGITVLLRQLYLLIVPFLLGWLVGRRGWSDTASSVGPVVKTSIPARIRRFIFTGPYVSGAAVSCCVMVALIAPWTVRNYFAFHQFVLLNTNAGYAFYWGNHPIHGARFIPILPAEGPSYKDLIPAELQKLDEASMERALLKAGLAFVRQDPLRFVALSLSRIREYFKFWPSEDSGRLSNIARVSSFGVFLPFMILGLVFSWKKLRSGNRAQVDVLMPLFLFIGFYTSIHLFSWTLIRYRLPIDAVLVIFAAFGLSEVARYTRNSYRSRIGNR